MSRPWPRALGAALILTLSACASSPPRPAETKATPSPAPEITRDAEVPEGPVLDEATRSAKLDLTCGDPARFGAATFETSHGDERRLLDRVRSRFAGTSSRAAALEDADRRALEDLVRRYLARCGQKDTIELTSKLIEFPTMSEREHAATGENFRAMADYLAAWSKDAGLTFRTFGPNDAWEIGLGSGARASVAFVMHGDVVPIDDGVEAPKPSNMAAATRKLNVPAGPIDPLTGEPLPPGWTKPPFRATIADGKLFGRGSEDDKGPIAAVLVMMRAMARLGLTPHGRVLAVVGTGEEHDWSGMKRYAASLSPPAAHVISVDANFPVVIAESGFVAWELASKLEPPTKRADARCARVVDAKGGQFLTQVPGEAFVLVEPGRAERIDQLIARASKAGATVEKELGPGFRIGVTKQGDKVDLRAFGEAVHSSTADEGKNALWALAKLSEKVGLCDGGVRSMLGAVARSFAGDHYGARLGVAYDHPVMGKLIAAPTVLRVEGDSVKLGVNMRRPAGMTSDEFKKRLDRAVDLLKKDDATIHEAGERYVGEPVLIDTSGPLVPTLLALYRTHAKEPNAQPIAIRGGTYARLFPGAVSFGPSIPGHPYRGHAPDEYIELEALRILNATLIEATLTLDAR